MININASHLALLLNLIATLAQLCGFISLIRTALKARHFLKIKSYETLDAGLADGSSASEDMADVNKFLLEQQSQFWLPLATVAFGGALQLASLIMQWITS